MEPPRPVVLFLNKTDRFTAKINAGVKTILPPDFSGDASDPEALSRHIAELFLCNCVKLASSRRGSVYVKTTCMIDSKAISSAFQNFYDFLTSRGAAKLRSPELKPRSSSSPAFSKSWKDSVSKAATRSRHATSLENVSWRDRQTL